MAAKKKRSGCRTVKFPGGRVVKFCKDKASPAEKKAKAARGRRALKAACKSKRAPKAACKAL